MVKHKCAALRVERHIHIGQRNVETYLQIHTFVFKPPIFLKEKLHIQNKGSLKLLIV